MEHRIDIKEILPADAYLATKYFDPHRDFTTLRVYYENGLVEAFDGKEWWTVCWLTSSQTEMAKQAIIKSGLTTANDLVDADVYDAAMLTFAWRINSEVSSVTNWAYPAVDHPAFEKLEAALEKLEKSGISNQEP